MGGINDQKWLVYYCYTHITSPILVVSRLKRRFPPWTMDIVAGGLLVPAREVP